MIHRLTAGAVARAGGLVSDSLLRNGILMMLSGCANLAAGFVFFYFASHYWPAHDVGISASVVSAMLLASTFADIGLGTTLIQELAKQRTDNEWSSVLNTFLAAGVCTASLAGIATVFLLQLAVPATSSLVGSVEGEFVVVAGVVLFTVSGLVGAAYIAQRRAEMSLMFSLAWQLLRISLLLVLARTVAGPIGIAVSSVAAAAVTVPIALVLGVTVVRRGYTRTQRGNLRLLRDARGSFSGHYLINLTGAVPLVLIPLMIASRRSPTEAAYYYAAWAVAGSLCSIAGAVAASLFVEGAHTVGTLPRLIRRSAIITISLLLPAMAIAVPVGPHVLALFGTQYAQHGEALFLILVLSAPAQAAITLYISSLRVVGQLRRAAALYTGTGAVAMIGAWVLLPSVGIDGTGISWLGAQTLGAGFAVVAWLRSRARPQFAATE